MKEIVLVMTGGAVGSLLRYLISRVLGLLPGLHLFGGLNPGVLTVNIVGSFIIGCLLALMHGKSGAGLFLFLTTGFLGGFTTFSAFSAEMFQFIQKNEIGYAILYILTTVIIGLASTWAGYKVFS